MSEDQSESKPSAQTYKLHVDNLRFFSSLLETQKALFEYFSKFGAVLDVKIMINSQLKRPKRKLRLRHAAGRRSLGRGFGTQTLPPRTQGCLSRFDHQIIVSRAHLATNSGDTARTGKLFVDGLPLDCSEQELVAYFARFGKLKRVHLPRDYNPSRKDADERGFLYVQPIKGFAFVSFSDPAAVQRVLASKNHFIRGKWVSLSAGC